MSVAALLAQDFSKGEWEEVEAAVREVEGVVEAVLVEGMDRALSGVRAR